jgi:hypothetical protein
MKDILSLTEKKLIKGELIISPKDKAKMNWRIRDKIQKSVDCLYFFKEHNISYLNYQKKNNITNILSLLNGKTSNWIMDLVDIIHATDIADMEDRFKDLHHDIVLKTVSKFVLENIKSHSKNRINL